MSIFLAVVLGLIAFAPCAAEDFASLSSDVAKVATDVTKFNKHPLRHDSLKVENDSTRVKRGLVTRIIDYFRDSNKPRKEKPIDWGFIGGPSYSGDTKLSVAVIGSAVYRSHFGDSLTPVSNASLYAEAAITGFMQTGIRGTHICERDFLRVPYDVSFEYYPTYYWGIGYQSDNNDDNRTKYVQITTSFKGACEFRLARDFYLGPAINIEYVQAQKAERPEMWGNEPMHLFILGSGFNLSYDSRDFIPNAAKGWYAGLEQRFYPKFFGNDRWFCSTELTLNHYRRIWKGGIIAGQFHATLTYGDTPWCMLAAFGGSHSMRGYYKNRYRDKNEIDATIELRQHVWRRNSLVVWAGAGNVFPRFDGLRMRHTLPCFGVGYRWEFKKRVNVRLDIGFGRGEHDFIINLYEVF